MSSALNKPSAFHVTWHPKSPCQDPAQLKLALQKIFVNVESITVNERRVTIKTSYTSANKTIEKKLQPFNGYVRWNRSGPLSDEQEAQVDNLFDLLAAAPSIAPTKSKKRKIMDSSEDEEEIKPKVAQRKSGFKKRNAVDDFINDDDTE